MWMDAYVHETLIRQQIADSNRTAALRAAVRSAMSQRPRAPWWPALQRVVWRLTAAFGSAAAVTLDCQDAGSPRSP